MKTFLSAENGVPWQEIHAALPYDSDRARMGETPDPRRYRDPKQLYETAGFLYEHEGRVWFRYDARILEDVARRIRAAPSSGKGGSPP